MNIVLDMDGTLLEGFYGDYGDNVVIKPRPHLWTFFNFIFYKFDRVSIWTNGDRNWFNKCYNEVLRYYVPYGCSFDFIITYDDGFVECRWTGAKELRKLYETWPDKYNPYNTFILDDSPHTYKHNNENAIPIKPFKYNDENEGGDVELLRIIQLLREYLFSPR